MTEKPPTYRCRCGERFTEAEFNRFHNHDCPWRRYENEHGESPPLEWAPDPSDPSAE